MVRKGKIVNTIDLKKALSEMLRESRKEAKPSQCILCGEKIAGLCNSHSVPQFILRNITIDGHVLNAAYALDVPVVNETDGINRSGTFAYICRDCDSKYFSEYENESALLCNPTNKMMAEIALKDGLHLLSKRNNEVYLYKHLQEKYHAYENKEILDNIQALDLHDFSFEVKRAKKIIDKDLKSGFVCIYTILLQYVVPIAAQSGIVLYKDLDGNIVNNVYDTSSKSRMQMLHCAIFPLKECTRIILFRHKDDRNYLYFEKQFSKLEEEKKLEYINYLVFKYIENYYLSPTTEGIINDHKLLKELSREINEVPNFGFIGSIASDVSQKSIAPGEIPCFLDKKYQLPPVT